MCAISMVMETQTGIWRDRYPGLGIPVPQTLPPFPTDPFMTFPPPITRQEFDALKREMEDLKKHLIAAKKYDEQSGQKDCEMADKVVLIKRIALLVGVDIADLQLEGK